MPNGTNIGGSALSEGKVLGRRLFYLADSWKLNADSLLKRRHTCQDILIARKI